MKKSWSILLISCVAALSLYSCTKDDHTWRDDNLAFIDKIKNREGIMKLGDSINGKTGAYYEVLQAGTGVKPIIGNTVKVAYAGWLLNDTITYTKNHPINISQAFDSGEKYQFKVGSAVIDGWNLAIQDMPVGSKWRIYLPYYLGYGTAAQTNIPAYSTLIFDISLIEIVSAN